MNATETRPFDIADIPQTISREARNRLVEALGINIKNLVSLQFHQNSIEIEVYALNAEGGLFLNRNHDTGEVAKHIVSIPVVD